MSISYGIYVGPYVHCGVERVDAVETRRSCSNACCENYGHAMPTDAMWCARCGTPTGGMPIKISTDAIDQWDIRESIEERLAGPDGDGYLTWTRAHGAHLWVPNIDFLERDPHLEAHTDFTLQDITHEQVRNDMRAFEVFFAPELAVLRKVYGSRGVAVRWGVIQDYS